MSIVTVRSWMYEKKGCQILIAAIMLLVMIGFVGPSFFGGNRGGAPDGSQVLTIVEVGGKPATSADLAKIQDLSRVNSGMPTTPRDYFMRQGSELSQAIELAAGDSLAAKYGVQPSREAAIKSMEEDMERQLFSMRIQLQMQKKLDMNATDKQFEEVFEKEYGQKISDIKAQQIESFKARLDDPTDGPIILRSMAVQAVTDHVALTLVPSEAELKKTYDNMVFNRLAFVDPKLTADQRKAKAEKARAALAGGKKFADVHKEQIGGTTPTPTELPVTQVESNRDYEPLKNLKKNEAVVISEFGQPVVYQYLSTKSAVPEDFEKNKAQLLKDFGKSKATTQVQDELKAIREDESKFSWKMPHLKVVYDLYQELTKETPNTTATPYLDIVKQIDAISGGDNLGGGDILVVAKHVALEEAFKLSTAAAQIDMKEDRAEAMAAALDVQDNTALRSDLADIYRELKKPDEAADNLTKAISNTVTFTPDDVKFVDILVKKAKSWEKAGFFTTDQVELVDAAAKSWHADKVQFEKDEAENKKLEEQAKKEAEAERKKLDAENEAERKRLEAEDKAKADAAKKSGSTPPATTGGATGTTGATTGTATTGTTGTTGLTGLSGATTGR